MNIRKSIFSGRFYEENPVSLKNELELYLSKSKSISQKFPLAIISPHAGYIFSGQTSADAFKQINKDAKYEHIFIIAPSHHALEKGAAVYNSGDFETPLGIVKVDHEFCSDLLQKYPELFHTNDPAQEKEHSIEVQLPFLQVCLKNDFNIVPILITTDQLSDCKLIAHTLLPYFNKNNLFIFSSDLSHYPEYNQAIKIDNQTIDAILSANAEHFDSVANQVSKVDNILTRACGRYPIATLLYLMQMSNNSTIKIISYITSGDNAAGDKNKVVGYASFAIYDIDTFPDISEEAKTKMLKYARKSIENYLSNTKNTLEQPNEPFAQKHYGVFVSLYNNNELRGCIGTFQTQKTLAQNIHDMAIAAATRDHRFRPVDSTELNDLTIEISILSPLKKIYNISEIVLGTHGIYIIKGTKSGTFLPQVAKKTGWTKEELLGHCSRDKAEIGWDGWKDAEIYIYETVVFGE
ncbi:MAG: AmmeMemoRadiSam system protein B [Bacteroidales bacterium]|nr:AmmeMemoRadiSam system protein B [Bacteroidales bacterium]